jgi:hypothetical protein
VTPGEPLFRPEALAAQREGALGAILVAALLSRWLLSLLTVTLGDCAPSANRGQRRARISLWNQRISSIGIGIAVVRPAPARGAFVMQI